MKEFSAALLCLTCTTIEVCVIKSTLTASTSRAAVDLTSSL